MNIYEMVTNRIIEKLEKAEESGEKFHWVKPFDITNSTRFACNYETQVPYTGINRLLAEPDEYLTFNQVKKINEKSKDDFLHIRNGAKGIPILYVNWKEVLDEDGNYNELKDLEEEDKDSFLSNDEFENSVKESNDEPELPSEELDDEEESDYDEVDDDFEEDEDDFEEEFDEELMEGDEE